MVYLLLGCVEYGLGDPDATVVPDVAVTETFQQAPLPGLDVLFVVDSTGSMAEEQAGLSGAVDRFLDGLLDLGVSYQVGVTTTDPADAGALQGRPWIITPSTPDPAGALAAALQVGVASVPPSAGLDGAARALADATGVNLGFRRDDAALHVVFIADGDDASGDWLGADPVAGFAALMVAEAARTGRAAVASAVVGDVPSGCSGPGGTALPGTRYAAVAEATGGEVVSICTANFGEVVDAITPGGVEFATEFVLQESPAEGSVTVSVDGERQESGWSVDYAAPSVVFAVSPPAGSAIEVRYLLAERP